MNKDAKTIQIFLPDGEPRGIRIAEITTRIVQAIQVPRTHLERAMRDRKEFDYVGAYFLFGQTDEAARPAVYIGQTEDLRARLKKHHADREFWTSAVIIVSKTGSFTLAHLRYLEWLSIKKATEAGRYSLENGNSGSKPFTTEPMEADVLDAWETAGVLLATLGFPVFEPPAGLQTSAADTYFCQGADVKASGRLVEDGFVVLSGSTARPQSAAAAQQFVANKRQSLLGSGVLVPDGLVLRFTQDYVFDTPSGAATLVLGRNANGWQEWKRSDGRTLHDVERAETE